jgi:hypothetical protein
MDPITMMLLAQGVGAGIQYFQGKKEAKKGEASEAALRAKGLPKMETPQEAFDLYENAKQNKYAQLATEQANQRFSDVASLMAQSGYRGLQNLGGAQRAADQSVAQIGQQQFAQEQGALQDLAGMQAQTERFNVGLEGQQYMTDLGMSQQAYQAGRQMQASAIDRALGAATSAIGGYSSEAYLNKFGDKIPFGLEKQKGGYQTPDSFYASIGLPTGEKGMKTPGPFSHEKNPIDLVKNGVKIGEATGGEYIFNPDQSKKMKQLAAQGDTPLHKYVGKMLKKFDNQAKK